MANIKSIHSVCNSIMQFLHNGYEAFPVPDGPPGTFMPDEYPCNFRVLSSGELKANADFGTTLSLYLYRVLMNEHARSRPVRSGGIPPLSVDLHFFLTIWAESAAAEQTICAWAMQQLHLHPLLDRSSLTEEGGWQTGEMVQIIPAELSNEDMMRIWDALAPDYRLTIPYIARVVRIDAEEAGAGLPVVATRYQFEEKNEDDA
jgi:hypothetical protein